MADFIFFAVLLFGIQFLISVAVLWSNAYDFNRHKRSYDSILNSIKNHDGGYYNSDFERTATKVKMHSKWVKISGTTLVTSPFAIVVVPLAVVSGLIYAIYTGLRTAIIPALSFKAEE